MSAAVDRLLIDVRAIAHPTARDRGIGRYTAGLLAGLQRVGAPVVGLFGGEADAERAAEAAPGAELRPWSPAVVREHADAGTWFLATQLMLHPTSLDPIPSAITAAGLPVAAVMYDVIPYRYPERYLQDPQAHALAALRAPLARTVDAMLAISQFALDSAAATLGFPPERMRTIGAGVGEQFVPLTVRAAPWPERLNAVAGRRYVVAVTGADERKNTEGLLRAWSQVDPAIGRSVRLVIATAAPAPVLRRWRSVAEEVDIAEQVVFTGYVTDDEMVALLQRSRLAVLPSFDEGFGLPVLEAAACGCPAICSSTSSLPEVLDEPAAWFDPGDPAAIAAAIERGVGDDVHRARLLAAASRAVQRFTWERVAEDVCVALSELGRRWPGRARRTTRRLAIAGRSPGVVADLAAALRRAPGAAQVDALTVEPTGEGRAPVGALGRYVKPWDYDDIVALIDDRSPIGDLRRLAERVPCHVWLPPGPFASPRRALAGARSVVVGDDETARIVRAELPGGPPIAVIPPSPAAVRIAAAGWTVDAHAAAVLAWLDAFEHVPGDTIRRFPAA